MKIYLIMALSIFSFKVFAKMQSVKIAYFHLPPHMIKTEDNTRPSGALINYFEEYIAPKMNIKINWVGSYDSFKRLNLDAKKSRFDMVSMITKFPDAESSYLFTKTPFTLGKHSIAVRSKSKLEKVEKVQDLFGLRVGHFSVDKSFYLDIFKNEKIEIEVITGKNWFERGIKMLLYNRIDVMYAPEEVPFIYLIKKNKLQQDIRILKLPVKPNLFYTVFTKKSKLSNILIKKFEQIISEIPISYDDYLTMFLSK